MVRRKKRKSSLLWYLLPILLGIIGGLIGYFFLRGRDKLMAERLLIWGIIFTVLGIVLQSIWITFGFTDVAEVTKSTIGVP